MAVDRVGVERDCRFSGRSSIVDPLGEILARGGPDDEVILHAEIDPTLARTKRLVKIPGVYELDRIGDRRPECYAPLITSRRPAAT